MAQEPRADSSAGFGDALALFRRLSSNTVASSFLVQKTDQFGGQVYNRSNANVANLSTPIGAHAIASGNRSTALGAFAYAKEDSSTCAGVYAQAAGPSSVAIGDQAKATGYRSIAIGPLTLASGANSVSLGIRSAANAPNALALGNLAEASGLSSVAVGYSSEASQSQASALGMSSTASAVASTAVGFAANAGFTDSIALGANSETSAINQFVSGSSTNQILDVYFGSGAASTGAPVAYTIHGSENRSGVTDTAGGRVTLAAGRGTGNSTPSRVHLTAPALSGTTGTTVQTSTDRFIVNATKTLLDNTLTDCFEIAVPTLTHTSGIVMGSAEAWDGTDVQTIAFAYQFAAVNKGGVFTMQVVSMAAANASAVSAGTIAMMPVAALASVANKVTFQLGVDTSLTAPSTEISVTYTVLFFGRTALTVL